MITRRTISGVAAAFVVAVVLATPASAQFIAPYAGYNMELEEFVIGGGVGLPVSLGVSTLTIQPGFEYYPGVDGISYYTFLVDIHYQIPVPQAPVQPYIGAGYALNRASVDVGGLSGSATTSQLNALGGVAFGSGPFTPFIEANLRFVDGTAAILKGGGRIHFGS